MTISLSKLLRRAIWVAQDDHKWTLSLEEEVSLLKLANKLEEEEILTVEDLEELQSVGAGFDVVANEDY